MAKMSDDDKVAVAAAGTGCGCIGAVVLAKLAFLVFLCYLAYELVHWVITK